VHRRLGLDVVERDRELVLVDDARRYLTRDDLAENTVLIHPATAFRQHGGVATFRHPVGASCRPEREFPCFPRNARSRGRRHPGPTQRRAPVRRRAGPPVSCPSAPTPPPRRPPPPPAGGPRR